MKLRSFRLRIALLTTVLAGTALVCFGAVAWRLIYVAKVNRLDARLDNQIRRASRPYPLDRWPSFLAELPRDLGTDANTPIALLILANSNHPDQSPPSSFTSYQSSQWPIDLDNRSVFPPPPPELQPGPAGLGPPRLRPPDSRSLEFRPDITPGFRVPEPQIPSRITTQRTATGSWRICAISLPNHAPMSQIAIAVNLWSIDQEMAVILRIFLISIPGTVLVIGIGAWALSGRALQPIRRLTSAIQDVSVTGLDRRIEIDNTDREFIDLIQMFNQMLERLDRSFKQASRFSADAAHELKTPLSILQGELEQALQDADLGSTAQQQVSGCLEEVQRLNSIVRKLLLLSLADAGQLNFQKTKINLSEILAVMVEDLDLLVPHLKIQLDITAALTIWGDRDLITQLLQNLISNAIKYNLDQGWIQIQAHLIPGQPAESRIEIKITNSSQQIHPDDRDHIFDRFYRGDPARTRQVEGLGLGLSLSREIAHAHGGTLSLDCATAQTTLILILPHR